MAYIVTDGFDLYRETGDMALRGWTQIPAGAGFVPGLYNHGRALRIPNLASAVFARRDFAGATELYVALDVLLDNLPTTANRLLSLYEGATDQINVPLNTTGTLAVRRTTTALATSTGALLANTRYRLELRAFNAEAGGIAEVRIDGAVFVTFTGDTRNGGTGVMNRLELWGPIGRTAKAPSGTRSTAATTKCATSSARSQSSASGGSRNAWSRLNGMNCVMHGRFADFRPHGNPTGC